MKKSLSLLLAIAMVFSMFAGVASAAESELTTQQKYEALKAKGIFAGMADGSAGLDQNMTRAQFARVAALILGLEGIGNPDTKVVTEKPFPDVELDAWYVEEVAAAKEAGIMQGNADGTFNPNGNITVQELAVVTTGLLGLEAVEGAEVDGAADWAAGYVQALLDKGIEFPTNYTQPATRAQLVDVAFQADEVINPVEPAKVSVKSAKATGVKKVEVQLDKAVDTSKAKLELKLGSAAVPVEKTEWSADNKTATLFLKDTTIREGNYTVTLSGVEDIGTASASFKGEKETVSKIEFVTASDEIAKSSKAKIKLRPENQYGEVASYSVSSYTVNTGDLTNTKKIDDEGNLLVTVDTSGKNTGLDVVPVYVYFNETRVMANKTFRVGATPFVSKLELGEVVYSSSDKALTKSGNTAEATITLLDQYGNPVTPEQVTADSITINWNSYTTPYNDAIVVSFEEKDDTYKVKVSIGANKKVEKSATYQINVFAGAATGTFNVDLKSVRVAKNVEIGQPTKAIAAGDASAIIPIIVTDEAGNELTAQEIADNADRIQVTGGTLLTYGKDKGKIKVTSIPTVKNSYFSVSVLINSAIGEAPGYDNETFQVGETRVPTSVVVDKAPAAKAVLAGATSKFAVVVKDQYGEVLKSGVTLSDTYTVVAGVYGADVATAAGKDTNAGNNLNTTTDKQTYTYNDGTKGFDKLVDGFEFTTTGTVGTVEVAFKLLKNGEEISSKTVRMEAVNPSNVDLAYSLENVGELFAAIDKKDTYFTDDATPPVVIADQIDPVTSKVAKQVKIVVKDAANNTVAFPNQVQEVVSSDLNVVKADVSGGKGYVIGNKAGSAKVSVYFTDAKGNKKVLTSDVTVKAEPVAIKSISVKDSIKLSKSASTTVDNAESFDAYEKTELKVTDQYGVTIEKGDVYDYRKLLGLRFVISDIVVNSDAVGAATVEFDTTTPTQINVGGKVLGFTLTAYSADGEVTAVTVVERP